MITYQEFRYKGDASNFIQDNPNITIIAIYETRCEWTVVWYKKDKVYD